MIISDTITLRAFDSEDSDRFREWINDGENLELFGRSHIVNELEHQQWYEKLAWDRSKLYLSIYENSSSSHIGNIWLENIDHKNAKAELFFISAKDMKQKSAIQAVNMMLKLSFGSINLNKIYSNVAMSNIETKNLLEKCGFRSEGILQDEIFINGQYDDVTRLAIFRNISKRELAGSAEAIVSKQSDAPNYQWFQTKKPV